MTVYALKIPADVGEPIEPIEIDPNRPKVPQIEKAMGARMDLCLTDRGWGVPQAVLFVDEWGRETTSERGQLPVNIRAWILYNRSPLFGDAFISLDSNDDGTSQPMDADLYIDMLKSLAGAAHVHRAIIDLARQDPVIGPEALDRLVEQVAVWQESEAG